MNPGLWTKIARETWRGTLLFATALFAFETLLSWVLPQFLDDLAGQLLQQPLFRNIVRALLGSDVGSQFGPSAMFAMAWVHPVVLALLWAHEIVFCTRMPVAEIDRGTADVLFALPLTRWQHYVAESLACLLSGLVLVGAALAGNLLGSSGADRAPPFGSVLAAAANLFALYWAVAGVGYVASAASDRRGRAVGLVFALVVGSLFLSFVAQFWEPARAVSVIGLLHYYRPLEVMESGAWPVVDLAVLFAVGTLLWLAGGLVFGRRDICTT